MVSVLAWRLARGGPPMLALTGSAIARLLHVQGRVSCERVMLADCKVATEEITPFLWMSALAPLH